MYVQIFLPQERSNKKEEKQLSRLVGFIEPNFISSSAAWKIKVKNWINLVIYFFFLSLLKATYLLVHSAGGLRLKFFI